VTGRRAGEIKEGRGEGRKIRFHERAMKFRLGNLVGCRTRYTTTNKTFSVKTNAPYEIDIYLKRQ